MGLDKDSIVKVVITTIIGTSLLLVGGKHLVAQPFASSTVGQYLIIFIVLFAGYSMGFQLFKFISWLINKPQRAHND